MSEVNFNRIGINNTYGKPAPKADAKAEVAAEQPKVQTEEKGAQVLSAMDAQGQLNAAQLGINKGVDPTKYLTADRISDIQNSMADFEKGVGTHRAALDEEFGHISEYSTLSDADKNEMAAKSFSISL